MQHLRRKTGPAALAVTFALALAACGGDAESSGSSEPAATEAASEMTSETGSEMSSAMESASESSSQAASDSAFQDIKTAADAVGYENNAKALASGLAAAAGLEGDVESQAAQTYAALSQLLQEHVYLAGLTLQVGATEGFDAPAFEAAAATLDTNSVELADLVGQVAPDQRDAFLELWRQHIGFFVDYTQAGVDGDQAAQEQAVADLDGYRTQAGQFFNEVSGGVIPTEAVASNLETHIDTVLAALDAALAGETTVFAELKAAATAVGETGGAKDLAAGLAQAAGMDGDVNSPAAQTYATLSTLLEEHVYLTGVGVKTAYQEGLDSPAFEAAAATLDTNSVDLADTVGSVAPEQRDAFLELWRQHIGFFVDYAEAAAAGDEQGIEQARSDLDQYRTQAGQFFEDVSGGEIPASAVEEGLDRHVETLGAAIEALAATYAQPQS